MKNLAIILSITLMLFSCENSKSNSDETVSESNTSSESKIEPKDEVSTVKLFINELGNQNYKDAYDLQAVSSWGNLEKFSSKSSFGGITSTDLKEIKQYPNENGKSVVYAEVFYADPANGNNTFKQKFYLQKFGEKFKIVDMKIVTANKKTKSINVAGEYSYTDGDYQSSTLSLQKNSKDKYSFSLSVGTFDGCTGQLEGVIFVKNGVSHYKSADCELKFEFTSNSVKITEKDCNMHGAMCSFEGTYSK